MGEEFQLTKICYVIYLIKLCYHMHVNCELCT